MKERLVGVLFSLTSILLLVGCSSMKTLTIEVREPATHPLPASVSSIAIVNNAGKQPADFQNRVILFKEKRDDSTINADSLGFYACFGLHDALLESGFPSVNILPKALRSDSLLQPAVPLTHTFVDSICKETNSEVLISVDQLLVGSLLDIEEEAPQGFRIARATFSTQRLSTFRIAIPADSSPWQSIQRSDTLYWDTQEPIVWGELNLNQVLSKLPIGRDAMHEAAYSAGVELAHILYPYWEQTERAIYTTGNSQMRRAFSLAKKEKWEEAATIWESVFKQKKGKCKAFACTNLALYNELKDNFTEAIKWQEISTEALPSANEDYLYFREYLNLLKQRASQAQNQQQPKINNIID